MRVLLDTNVIVSAVTTRGLCADVFRTVLADHELVTCPKVLQEHRLALAFIGIVAVEVLILVVNRMSCPLTAIAARYTDDRRANFDIYLPEWLARHNKTIFGSLYVMGVVLTLLRMS